MLLRRKIVLIVYSCVSRAITSAVVTIPAMVYLLQPTPDSGHGHGHDADEQHGDESQEGQDGEEAQAGESSDKPAPNSEPGDIIPDLRRSSSQEGEDTAKEGDKQGVEEGAEDQSDDSSSEGDDRQDTPDTSDDEQPKNVAHETESGGNVEGVKFKGATSGGTRDGEQGDTRKHIPDAKGGNKKRIESHYGKRQGVAGDDDLEPDETGRTKDKVSRILYRVTCGLVQILITLLACNGESTWRYDYNFRQAGRYLEYGYQTLHGPRQRPREKQERRRRTGNSKIQRHNKSIPPPGMLYRCDKISSNCTDTMIDRESTWAGRR